MTPNNNSVKPWLRTHTLTRLHQWKYTLITYIITDSPHVRILPRQGQIGHSRNHFFLRLTILVVWSLNPRGMPLLDPFVLIREFDSDGISEFRTYTFKSSCPNTRPWKHIPLDNKTVPTEHCCPLTVEGGCIVSHPILFISISYATLMR